jgi:transcriptional regulator with XRE-family HTH domain
MSAANLSRIENGEQGPPSAEVLEGLARALDTDLTELLTLAGRGGPTTSPDVLLHELRALRAEIKDGFARVEEAIQRQR